MIVATALDILAHCLSVLGATLSAISDRVSKQDRLAVASIPTYVGAGARISSVGRAFAYWTGTLDKVHPRTER